MGSGRSPQLTTKTLRKRKKRKKRIAFLFLFPDFHNGHNGLNNRDKRVLLGSDNSKTSLNSSIFLLATSSTVSVELEKSFQNKQTEPDRPEMFSKVNQKLLNLAKPRNFNKRPTPHST